MTKPMQLHRH